MGQLGPHANPLNQSDCTIHERTMTTAQEDRLTERFAAVFDEYMVDQYAKNSPGQQGLFGDGLGGNRPLRSPKTQQKMRWVTVHPPGHEKGTPVLIDGEGKIKGGMGGKFDGQKISSIGKGNPKADAGKSKEPAKPKASKTKDPVESKESTSWDSIPKEGKDAFEKLALKPLRDEVEKLDRIAKNPNLGPRYAWEAAKAKPGDKHPGTEGMNRWTEGAKREGVKNPEKLVSDHPELKKLEERLNEHRGWGDEPTGQKAKKDTSGIQEATGPKNEDAKEGDQLGMFGEATRKPTKKADFTKGKNEAKQANLIDGLNAKRGQMSLVDEAGAPDDMVYKPESKASEFPRQGEIDRLKAKMESTRKVWDSDIQTPGAFETGRSNRSKSLSRQHARNVDRHSKAFSEYQEAKSKHDRLEAIKRGWEAGELYDNGQRRKDSPSRKKLAEGQKTIAELYKSRLKPGDSVALAGNPNNTVKIKRVNKNTVTTDLGSKWDYADILMLDDEGKPITGKRLVAELKGEKFSADEHSAMIDRYRVGGSPSKTAKDSKAPKTVIGKHGDVGHFVTIDDHPVFIKTGGEISRGPKHLRGKNANGMRNVKRKPPRQPKQQPKDYQPFKPRNKVEKAMVDKIGDHPRGHRGIPSVR